MHLKISLHLSKKAAFILFASLVLLVVVIFYLKQSNQNPLPNHIKGQLNYKVIYPSNTNQIDSRSYNYQPDNKALSFNVKKNGSSIVFTEQPTPDALGSDTQAYYPALGIHPYAQFKTSLGLVALTKFWQSSSFKFYGQSGVMATQGTFLIAHSEKNLTNAEWKDLFESLKITR